MSEYRMLSWFVGSCSVGLSVGSLVMTLRAYHAWTDEESDGCFRQSSILIRAAFMLAIIQTVLCFL